MHDPDRTASFMTPAQLAQFKSTAPASPAAWLDQMAADAGHAHVRRLAEVRKVLQAQAQRHDFTALAAVLAQLGQALARLDFTGLLARGWWARVTGKARSAGARFAGEIERIDQAAVAVTAQAQALHKLQQEHHTATELALLDFEVEYRAVEQVINQGARWLQDMRAQLKTRQAQAADDQSRQQIKDDVSRCEILVERLKVLRAVTAAAQHSHQQAQEAATRRKVLLQVLQQDLAVEVKAWRAAFAGLAAAAADDDSAVLNLEGPQRNHRELQLRLKQAGADCAQLQLLEGTLADSLVALGGHLESVVS